MLLLLLLVVFSNNDVTGGGGMVGMGWTPFEKIPLPTALLSGSGTCGKFLFCHYC
jgi:hypothetical protein